MPGVALGIIHAPHLPARQASFERMLNELIPAPMWVRFATVHQERESSRAWAHRSWEWAYKTGADFSLILNDDVLPAPRFWECLRAMLHVLPRHAVLGLGTVDPLQAVAHGKGERWLRLDHCSTVGWGVGLWREEVEYLHRWESSLPDDHMSPHGSECPPGCNLWHEDSWANEVLHAASPRRRVWHPIPAILDHDTSVPSTYANDHHKTRRPPVRWDHPDFAGADLTSVEFWRV